MTTTMSFTKAAKEFFGLLPGQKLQDFAAELKALPLADREDLAAQLSEVMGVTVEVGKPAA